MIKQVIVMRKDLNMRKGKMIAQGAHASVAVLLNKMYVVPKFVSCPALADEPRFIEYSMVLPRSGAMHEWLSGAFTKIVVGCNSEEELFNIEKLAETAGLPCALIQDAGRTEFDGVPTYTCLAIGPAKAEEIDKITGKLRLL